MCQTSETKEMPVQSLAKIRKPCIDINMFYYLPPCQILSQSHKLTNQIQALNSQAVSAAHTSSGQVQALAKLPFL